MTMASGLRSALALLLVVTEIGATAALGAEPALVFRTQGYNTKGQLFVVDILELRPHEGQHFAIEIECLSLECSGQAPYREETDWGLPTTLFQFNGPFAGKSNHFVTVWTAGSYSVVRIYDVSSGTPRKVLDGRSKWEPQFNFADGAETVVLGWGYWVTPGDTSGSWEERMEVWRWNGSEYTLAHQGISRK